MIGRHDDEGSERAEPFATRIRPSVRSRIRLAAELQGRSIYELVDELLDHGLPSLTDLVSDFSTRTAGPAKNSRRPGLAYTRKDTL